MALTLMKLFEPKAPVRGMRSAIEPGSLPPGIFANLTNLRFDQNRLRVRDGLRKLTAAVPVANASLRGQWSGYIRGVFTIVAAYRVSTATRVYTLDPAAFTWTEITDDGVSDARNGNTRFATDASVVFQPLRDQKGVELLLIQNGADAPRIYDPSQPIHEKIAVHSTISPTDVSNYSVLLDFPSVVSLWENGSRNAVAYTASVQGVLATATNATPIAITFTGGNDVPTGSQIAISGLAPAHAANGVWTYTRTGVRAGTLNGSVGNSASVVGGKVGENIAFADSGSGLNLTATMSIDAATVANDFATLTFFPGQSAIDLTQSPQLVLIFSTSFYGIWNQIAIIAKGPSGEVTLWDPTSSLISPVYLTDVDPLDPNAVMVGFSLASIAGSVNTAVTQCQALKFKWVGTSSPPSNTTCLIDMIAASGKVPGQPQYGIAWQNSQSRAESYGQILTNVSTTTLQRSNSSPNSGLQLPNSTLFYYRSTVTVLDVAAAQISAGVDTLRIYRQDFGEVQFTLALSSIVNAWSGSAWPTANALTQVSVEDPTLSAAKDFSQTMPDAYHVPIPTGSPLTHNGSRLYVGGTGTNRNEAWISDSTSQVKFRTLVRFLAPNVIDPTSPARVSFPGEVVTALRQSPGQYVGVAPVFVFTNRSVWRLDGVDATSLNRPTRVNNHGCPFAGSIAEHYGDVFWVDPEREVRSIQGGAMVPYSKYKVDDKLIAGDLTNASAAFMKDRYYLAYQPAGQSANTNVLLLETLAGEWGEDVPEAGDARALLTIDDSIVRKVYMFTVAGLVYQVESPGQATDDGTPIQVSITTPEIHQGFWQKVSRKRLGLVSDTGTGTLTVSSTWRPEPSGQDGTITLTNMPGSPTRTWLWETATLNGGAIPPGGSGLSVQLNITGALPSGFNIYSLVLEFEALAQDGASPG